MTFLRAACGRIIFNNRIITAKTLRTVCLARASYAVRHPLIAEVASIGLHFEVRRDIVVGIIVRNLDAGLAVVILTRTCTKRCTREAEEVLEVKSLDAGDASSAGGVGCDAVVRPHWFGLTGHKCEQGKKSPQTQEMGLLHE